MRRKIGICFFVLAVFVASVLIPVEEKIPPAQTEEEASIGESENAPAVHTSSDTAYCYMIREDGGKLVVYRAQSDEIYMETGIRAYEMPDDIKENLEQGIGFTDEESLFEFLENYSS